MKKILSCILVIAFIGMNFIVHGQVSPTDPNYEQIKAQGQITLPEQVPAPVKPVSTIKQMDNTKAPVPGLLVPRDGTFTLAMGPNDDGSTGLIGLPFTFCLYGDQYNNCYINNNGNVSFGAPYFQFTSTGFPVAGFPMVAPFWADVDTRSCGTVWYKILPTRMIVIWEETGYYYIHCDKLNTFELIMTNGTDPLIGVGKNVAFSYADMSWTTGDASNGVLGFGGYPATVGINKGDGLDYALVGLFDKAGTSYDGPTGSNDGVDWLDEKDFAFDGCAGEISVTPVSDWALFIGIGLILTLAVIRLRRLS